MRSVFGNKIWIILAAIAAILALEVLASGIDKIHFREATPYSWELPLIGFSELRGGTETEENPFSLTIVIFWVVLISLAVVISLLVSKKFRKLFLTRVLQGIAFAIVLYYGMQLIGEEITKTLEAIEPPAQNGLGEAGTTIAPPPFVPPDSTSPWSYVITLAVLIGIFLAGWWYYRHRHHTEDVRLDIADIARETLHDIQTGKDWGDTITRCYLRMTEAVNTSRGIMRPAGMTPAEFAGHLEHAGLPSAPVRRLTALFERVRYGGKNAQVEEQQEAIMCLNSIIRACGGETA